MPGNQKPRTRKHRGTQTGSISRASRSRPRSRQEAMAQARNRRGTPAGKRQPVDKREQPPTWSSAAKRGILFALLLFPLSLVFGQEVGPAILLTLVAAVFYIPLGYVTQKFFYDRHMKRLAKERAARQAEKAERRGR